MLIPSLITVITALLFSAFFSGLEIAYLSSNKLKLELDKKQNKLFSHIAELFSRNGSYFMSTILIGNNIALVIYSLQMTKLSSVVLKGGHNLIVETIISTIFIIFIAEYIPKSMVRYNPNFYYRYFSYPASLLYYLLYPISRFTTYITKGVMVLLGVKSEKGGLTPNFNKIDLEHLAGELDINEESSPADAKDIQIFKNALDFSDVRVRDCMIQRIEIEAIDQNATIDQARDMFVETQFSRIPIYSDSIDNIIGYINIKQLFQPQTTIKSMMHQIVFVPETMSCQKLLTQFIKNKQSIAVVIDEFGATAGIITIEDILEEIFGEIDDEHDTNDLIEKQLSENYFVLSARHEVKYLNEKYGFAIPESDEYDTIAGYIIQLNDDLPSQGDLIEDERYSIKILKMNSSRIELIKLKTNNVELVRQNKFDDIE